MCTERNIGAADAWRGRRGRKLAGFTLVELLVVIGIIALLISILLPSLNAARRQATRIACAANIRSIGQSYQLYAAEYKGQYPPVQMWHWPIGNWGNPWYDDNPASGGDRGGNPAVPDGAGLLFVNGYVKDPRIYYCPAQEEIAWTDWQDQEQHWRFVRENATKGDVGGRGPDRGLTAAHNGYMHYANWYNQWNDMNWPPNRADIKDEAGVIKRPGDLVARSTRDRADRILATDMMLRRIQYDWGINMNNHLLPDTTPTGRKRTADPDPTRLVEFEGGNVLFNDGHAEWRNASETRVRWAWTPIADWFEAYW